MADIFDSAFRLYRIHFLRLIAIAIIVGAPMLLVQEVVLVCTSIGARSARADRCIGA
jgi:hypothetical protein